MADGTTVLAKPPEVKKMATKAQQALDALAKIESLKKEAIQELLDERKKIDDQLAQLGYEAAPAPKSSKGGGAGKPRQKSETCNICKYATDPQHDGRHPGHRAQGDNKKPFTQKELTEYGLTKKAAAA